MFHEIGVKGIVAELLIISIIDILWHFYHFCLENDASNIEMLLRLNSLFLVKCCSFGGRKHIHCTCSGVI